MIDCSLLIHQLITELKPWRDLLLHQSERPNHLGCQKSENGVVRGVKSRLKNTHTFLIQMPTFNKWIAPRDRSVSTLVYKLENPNLWQSSYIITLGGGLAHAGGRSFKMSAWVATHSPYEPTLVQIVCYVSAEFKLTVIALEAQFQ